MFKKLNKMKIGARLKKSFRQIILIFGILSALVVVIMLYTIIVKISSEVSYSLFKSSLRTPT